MNIKFSDEKLNEVKELISHYPDGKQKSAILPVLHLAQDEFGGWLDVPVMDYVAELLNILPIEVYEVATFYFMFNTTPIGKYHLQVCTTTPCWLRGSDEITAACQKETGIKAFGETSDDGLFTMTEVECLGACVNAPILQVDDDFYEDMDAAKVTELLAALRKGERPAPGSMTGRQTSAPEGGPNTLTTLHFAPEG